MFAKANWKPILIGMVCLAIYGYWWDLKHTIASLTKDVADKTVEVKTAQIDRDLWKSNYSDLKEGLTKQKEVLETLSATADATNKNFGKLQTTMTAQVGSLSAKLQDIASRNMKNLTADQAIDHLKQQALQSEPLPAK